MIQKNNFLSIKMIIKELTVLLAPYDENTNLVVMDYIDMELLLSSGDI